MPSRRQWLWHFTECFGFARDRRSFVRASASIRLVKAERFAVSVAGSEPEDGIEQQISGGASHRTTSKLVLFDSTIGPSQHASRR